MISAVRGQERTYLFEKETIEAHLPEAIVKQRSTKGPRTLQKPSISTPPKRTLVWVATDWYGMFIIFIPVYIFLFLPMRLVMAGETTGFLPAASQIQWGLMAFVFGLSHLAFLRQLPVKAGTAASGPTLAARGEKLSFGVTVDLRGTKIGMI